jgi:stearoyl-CoA desaturase (delta-9 desaturase)
MRPPVFRVQSSGADAAAGRVVWAPVKSFWNGALLLCAFVFAPATASLDSVFVFVALMYTTLLFGHSVGMHRRLIHQSFDCPKWLERVLVYLGVVVGMAGPIGILRIHDIRDWAQREPSCHDFFAHRRPLWLDALWQLTCRFEFERAPTFIIEPEVSADPWYQWLERTWMLQQIPIAAVLFALGGWGWVVWGVFVRVSVSVTGHWVVTYLTHNPGPGVWRVPDAGVQASNLTGYGLITMGECWHNNHHAFPESARMGLNKGEGDPGWWVIDLLHRAGLVTRVGLPRDETMREDLLRASA